MAEKKFIPEAESEYASDWKDKDPDRVVVVDTDYSDLTISQGGDIIVISDPEMLAGLIQKATQALVYAVKSGSKKEDLDQKLIAPEGYANFKNYIESDSAYKSISTKIDGVIYNFHLHDLMRGYLSTLSNTEFGSYVEFFVEHDQGDKNFIIPDNVDSSRASEYTYTPGESLDWCSNVLVVTDAPMDILEALLGGLTVSSEYYGHEALGIFLEQKNRLDGLIDKKKYKLTTNHGNNRGISS